MKPSDATGLLGQRLWGLGGIPARNSTGKVKVITFSQENVAKRYAVQWRSGSTTAPIMHDKVKAIPTSEQQTTYCIYISYIVAMAAARLGGPLSVSNV